MIIVGMLSTRLTKEDTITGDLPAEKNAEHDDGTRRDQNRYGADLQKLSPL